MSEWKPVSDAIDAIKALSRSETIDVADFLKREAILAISRMQHHNSEVSAALKMLELMPIEIASAQTWATGEPVRYDRYASFSDTGESVADQLWQVYGTALDSFAKDWHARQ